MSRRRLRLAACAAALAVLPPQLAAAAAPVLSDAELDAQRGGVATPLGFDIGFGASVKTFVDGSLALETRLTWTESGIMSETVVDDLGASAGAWTGSLAGVPGGATVVLHDVSAERVASLVINTADNRVIRQQTDITLVLPQLAAFQQQVAAAQLAATLQSNLGLAAREAAAGR